MATNKIKDIDITESGPMTFRDLQAVNQEPYTNLSPEFQAFSEGIGAITAPTSLYDARAHGEQLVLSPLSGTNTPWGESRFDEANASEEQFQHLGDVRANNQPWYAKISAGVAKGAVLAGTTFADGTVGLVVGATQAITEQRFSALWDNPFSKAMQEINELSEEYLPNYYSEKELEGPWYENIFTANFIGDKFIKNLGFTVGAYYSGGAFAKALKVSKLPKFIGLATKSTKAPAMVTSAAGAAMSAINEGRIEALNNSKDWFEAQKVQLDDQYEQTLNAIQAQYGNSEIYDNLVRQAELDYNQSLEKLAEDRLKMGNADLLMNLPILLASNIIQFGRLYAQGYKTTRKATDIIRREGKYATAKTYAKGAGKASLNALSEGVEEISQSAASRISGNYYATDVNNFYKSKIDPQAEQDTLSWMKAFAQGINETVNDGSAWEEFFIGALTGALGMPRFRGIRNSEGKFQSPITLDGGIYGEMKEYKKQRDREQKIADAMNKRLESPEFRNYYQGLIRHNKYQQDMDNATVEGDEFDFKNAEHAQLLSDIMMFDNAGKMEDLFTLINAAYDTSDENLASIVENTTSINTDESGKEVKIGPFIDKNGNPMYSTPEGKQKMIDKLTQTKEDIESTINDYIKTKDDIDIRTGEQLSDDQLEELVWLKSQIKNWQGRAETLAGEVNPVISNIIGGLSKIADYLNPIKTSEGQKHADLTDTYRKADEKERVLRDRISILEQLKSLDNKTLASILAVDKGLVKDIKEVLDNPESQISQDEIESINTKIDDIVKLEEATTLFNTKLKEYLANPSKITEDNEKVTTDTAEEDIKNKTQSLKDKLATATDLNSFRSILDNEEDSTIKQSTLDSLEEEGNELAKSYKDMNAYNAAVSRAINSSDADSTTKEDALKLLQNQYKNSSTLDEMANMNSVYITDEYAVYDDSLSEDDNIVKHQSAMHLLQSAMVIANESNRFKDRFSKVVEVENTGVTEESSEEAEEKETTGSSEVSTVPTTTASATTNKAPTPVGDTSSEDVSNENREINDAQENLTDDKRENKQYYRPAIPELHIEASKSGDFRPFPEVVIEREGLDFSTIYNYLRDKGAFDYVNSGKLKSGAIIKFMIDPVLEEAMKNQLEDRYNGPTILMVTESGQVVGSLDSTPSSVNKFSGLKELRDKVSEEYNKADKSKPFIATPTTSVSKMMVGKVPYSSEERSLREILPSGSTPTLGVIQSGSIHTGNDTKDRQVINPKDTSNKEGRLYLLLTNAASKYSPVAVRVKHFNDSEFNPNDVNVTSTPIYKQIQEAIGALASVNNEDDLRNAVSKLGDVLYTGTLHIDLVNNKAGDTLLRISKVELDEYGREIYDEVNGKKIRRETTNFIKLFNDPTKSEDYIGSIGGEPTIEHVDTGTIINEINTTLLGFNLPIQVNWRKLGDSKYVDNLVSSNVLTSNITEAAIKGSWFTTNPIENGIEQKAVNPKYNPSNSTRNNVSPVGGTENLVEGTKVTVGNTPYIVNRKNNKVYNSKGIEVNPRDRELLLDLAYIQDIYGDKENGSKMWNNKVLLPSGRVLDRTTQKYLTGKERKEALSHINAEDSIEEKKEHSNTTLEEIEDNQQKVEETTTEEKSNLPVFNNTLEVQNPINRVLPNYELKDSKVGYYELDGKLYKGYLSPIGEIKGNLVYMTKEPVMSKGFNKNKEEYVAFNRYIAVFSNGQAVVVVKHSNTSDTEESVKTIIRNALENNHQRVVEEASKVTTISKSILPSSSNSTNSTLSGAARTIQAEKAIDKSDSEFEDELDLDRLRKKDKENEVIWNQEKELNWLDKVLPLLSKEDRVKVVKGLIKVGNQGAVAWGQFSKGMITLSDIAAEGTTYHEAFHVVFNLLLDPKERQTLYEEARQIYGNKGNLSLEEEMAEGFREYVMSRDIDNLLTKIKNFFKDLWISVTNWNKVQPSLLSIYQRINKGEYANKELSNTDSNESTKYRKLSSIKELRDKAKTQYEQYNVDMEEYYRYAQSIVKELNNRRYNTAHEAREAFNKSGIDPSLFYRITKLNANNATGYKIQLLTRDLFEDYKKNNNPAIIDDIYDSIKNKPEEFLFNTLDPETQMSLLNKGWTEEQWNNEISQEERDQALRCLSL